MVCGILTLVLMFLGSFTNLSPLPFSFKMTGGGLTTYLRSYYFSAVSPQSQSTAMLQVTLALLFDLGLNRAVREDEAGPATILADASRKAWSGEYNPREKRRTLDERRAFLYCYFLASVYVTPFLQRSSISLMHT